MWEVQASIGYEISKCFESIHRKLNGQLSCLFFSSVHTSYIYTIVYALGLVMHYLPDEHHSVIQEVRLREHSLQDRKSHQSNSR